MKNGPSTTEEMPKVDAKQHAEVMSKIDKLESSQFTVTGTV